MAKPRVFVSSTYYDLKHIRHSLELFIEDMGFEGVLFESGDIPFRHDRPPDKSCYAEIQNCHILVLIIGSRYGSPATSEKPDDPALREKAYEFFNSITKEEYETARKRDIPIFIFVDKNVLSDYETFRQNRENIVKYVHVDSINVFHLLDNIWAQERNNFVKGFENFDDISLWLRDQWAGLFAEYLSQRSTQTTLRDLASQIDEMKSISAALKNYTESIIKRIQPKEAQSIITRTDEILRKHQIERFAEEPMIDYLTAKYKLQKRDDALFEDFRKSESLEEFLSFVGMTPEEAKEFVVENASRARRDFRRYKRYYAEDHDGKEETGSDVAS